MPARRARRQPDAEVKMALLQIRPDQVNQILGQLGSDLLFSSVDEMESDVRLQHFGHEAINAAADSGKEHQLPAAIFVGVDKALDGIQLTAQATDALQLLQLLTFVDGHKLSPRLDNTHPGYSINPEGV